MKRDFNERNTFTRINDPCHSAASQGKRFEQKIDSQCYTVFLEITEISTSTCFDPPFMLSSSSTESDCCSMP